jgi:D-alanine--poly(phosphoribitol) ligase subunit 1
MLNLLNQIRNSLVANRERAAFCFKDQYYSYQELSDKIVSIRELLANVAPDHGAGRNIGVVTHNDLETYSALLACWFSGFAYVPINPALPRDRNRIIIREAGIKYILNSCDRYNDIADKEADTEIVPIKNGNPVNSKELVIPAIDENRNAYIIFTSGSTGVPKGVPITHANLAAFTDNFFSTDFNIEASDKCLQMFELTFDVSVSSFLLPLLRGACVFPVGDEGIRYMQVLKFIQQYQLTSIQIVPSVIRLAGPLLKRLKFPWVRNCILTGEATYTDLVPEWKTCLPNARIYDFYGPTEATIYCSFYKCDTTELKNYNGMLSIGGAMGNTELLVLDGQGLEVPAGVKGELYIGSKQLSSGYLNNPSQTSGAFVTIPNKDGSIFYKSGDMVYKDAAGDIFYCGRFDNQVKIQGFRVELGEIEFLVRSKFKLNNIVVVLQGKNNESELMLILESDKPPDNHSMLNYLREQLPQYMVPSQISCLKEFPLTGSGKTDRKKVKEFISVGVKSD